MNLEYAVDRLYAAGWLPDEQMELERLPDGRWCPSIFAVQREFLSAGLELAIKHVETFNCYRASWIAIGDGSGESGTVIGSCAKEAAVYALAQLRSSASTASALQEAA